MVFILEKHGRFVNNLDRFNENFSPFNEEFWMSYCIGKWYAGV